MTTTLNVPGSAGWRDPLRDATRSLRAVFTHTEQGFLSTGSRLREVHTGAQAFSSRLSNLLTTLTEQNSSATFSGIRGLSALSREHLGVLDNILGDLLQHLETLQGVVVQIPGTLSEFTRNVSRLRMMGIATRIESARIGMAGSAFEHLAVAVTNLGDGIAAKTGAVLQHLRTIGEVISSNALMFRELRKSHGEILDVVETDLGSNARLMEEKHELYVTTISGVKVRSEEAVHSVQAAVQSLQYHDITQQQVMHVVEALEQLAALEGAEESLLAEVIPVCTLQAAHLRRAARELDDAVLSTVTSLGGLAQTTQVMVSQSNQMAEFTGSTGAKFFGLVEQRMREVVRTLARDGETIHSMVRSLDAVGEMIDTMKRHMEEMANVGIEIELLALNARVRAAKVGKEGAGLGTISEAIQKLSGEAGTELEAMGSLIDRLIEAWKSVSQTATGSSLEQVSRATVDGMDAEIEKYTASYRQADALSGEVLGQTERECTVLGASLEQTAGELSRLRNAAQELLGIADGLEHLSKDLSAAAPPSAEPAIQKRMEELEALYTMDNERRTHHGTMAAADVLAGAADGAGKSGTVELF